MVVRWWQRVSMVDIAARARQSKGERVRNGGSRDVASLFTPIQPDQWA